MGRSGTTVDQDRGVTSDARAWSDSKATAWGPDRIKDDSRCFTSAMPNNNSNMRWSR